MAERRFCPANADRSKNEFSIPVVGENDNWRCMVANLLRFHGYHCQVAASGVEAIDMLQESKADMVIADPHLSDLGGAES